MTKKNTQPKKPIPDEVNDEQVRVAYHDGPPEIGFCGIQWQRGEAQTITTTTWQAMQLRANFKHYNFTEEK